MGALTWRLRAAEDFAAFLSRRGKVREGFDILNSVYNLFTEGHESPMLTRCGSNCRLSRTVVPIDPLAR